MPEGLQEPIRRSGHLVALTELTFYAGRWNDPFGALFLLEIFHQIVAAITAMARIQPTNGIEKSTTATITAAIQTPAPSPEGSGGGVS